MVRKTSKYICLDGGIHDWITENDGWHFIISKCSKCQAYLEESQCGEVRFLAKREDENGSNSEAS